MICVIAREHSDVEESAIPSPEGKVVLNLYCKFNTGRGMRAEIFNACISDRLDSRKISASLKMYRIPDGHPCSSSDFASLSHLLLGRRLTLIRPSVRTGSQ